MSLKQQTIDEVLRDCHTQLRAIDTHAGLIAECESLAERLNESAMPNGYRFSPVVSTCRSSVTVWVQINYERRSDVYSVIRAAGIEIAGDSKHTTDGYIQIHLEGFDVPICMGNIAEELAEAA